MPESCVVGKSETGWMKSNIFYEYVANELDHWLNSNNIKRPLHLFIDGHKSHMAFALSETCEKKQIILYALPPNTTHTYTYFFLITNSIIKKKS